MENQKEDLSWLNLPEDESTEPMIDTFAVETLLQNRTTDTASKRLSGILGEFGVQVSAADLKSRLAQLNDSDVSELLEVMNTTPAVVFISKLAEKLNIEDAEAV